MPTVIICTLPRSYCLSTHTPCVRTPCHLCSSSSYARSFNLRSVSISSFIYFNAIPCSAANSLVKTQPPHPKFLRQCLLTYAHHLLVPPLNTSGCVDCCRTHVREFKGLFSSTGARSSRLTSALLEPPLPVRARTSFTASHVHGALTTVRM
eukprot:506738-Pyramimonas_sp.AAC.1